jgi:hypothetical protein
MHRGCVRHLVIILLAPILVTTLASTDAGAADSGCSQTAIQQAASSVRGAHSALMSFHLSHDVPNWGDIPPGGAEAISKLKNAFGELADTYMRCAAAGQPDPNKIQQDLSRLAGVPASGRNNPAEAEDVYGTNLQFHVKTGGGRRVIGITPIFNIQCATDAMLMVFAYHSGIWSEVLRWEAKPYEKISGAFSSFQYKISPMREDGSWYVVDTRVPGWCSSTWSVIDYEMLRAGEAPDRPRILLAKSESMWWGSEDFGHIKVNPTDFEVRYHSNSIDAGVHNRVFIRHYRIDGDSLTRIPPVAMSPRDFVDEWIVSDWSDAQKWSLPSQIVQLKAMHSKLYAPHSFSFDFDSARRCHDAADDVQIGLCPNEKETFYFRVRGRSDFQIISVRDSPDPACQGKNLLDTMETK